MITEATQNGRSRELTTNTSQSLLWGYAIILITATAASRVFSLVDARTLMPGHEQVVANIGANAFQITDASAGNLVTSLTTNQWARLTLVSNATAAGVWSAEVSTRLT